MLIFFFFVFVDSFGPGLVYEALDGVFRVTYSLSGLGDPQLAAHLREGKAVWLNQRGHFGETSGTAATGMNNNRSCHVWAESASSLLIVLGKGTYRRRTRGLCTQLIFSRDGKCFAIRCSVLYRRT